MDIDRQTEKIVEKWHPQAESTTPAKETNTNIYYRAHFSTFYKEEERIMKQTVNRNVSPTSSEKKLNLIIYYKGKKTSHLLLRNSPPPEEEGTKAAVACCL